MTLLPMPLSNDSSSSLESGPESMAETSTTTPATQPQPSHPLSHLLLSHHQYAPHHFLQSYELYIPPSPAAEPPRPKPWLIHLHGGAWRDPTITAATSFLPTLSHLLLHLHTSDPNSSSPHDPTPSPPPSPFAGYASLNYRLSPHPSHPQDPRTTPPSAMREARHPDHLVDVLTGLKMLQKQYGFGGNYVLLGHSCGGTLAWQVAMSGVVGGWDGERKEGEEEEKHRGLFADVMPPLAIISVCAIYDIPLLVHTFEHVSAYREFTVGAFGAEERVWADASPAQWGDGATAGGGGDKPSAGLEGSERRKRPAVAVLAHSRNDELVDWGQVERMEGALKARQETGGVGWKGRFRLLELEGRHDEVWKDGREMVMAVRAVMEMLGSDLEGGVLE